MPVVIAMYWSASFSVGAWFTGVTLLVFAMAEKMAADAAPLNAKR
jgi:hypothetical protein